LLGITSILNNAISAVKCQSSKDTNDSPLIDNLAIEDVGRSFPLIGRKQELLSLHECVARNVESYKKVHQNQDTEIFKQGNHTLFLFD
jgi:hypothetical protein